MIKTGDKIPNTGFKVMGENGPEDRVASSLFGGRKVVLFSVPGAFTPTCSARHLPGFVDMVDDIRAKGVDEIACVAVNDVFVMAAWGLDQKAGGKITMLSDGSGKWIRTVGLELDLTEAGLGRRGQRFAMIIEDGILTWLAVEEGGVLDVSSAEKVLLAL